MTARKPKPSRVSINPDDSDAYFSTLAEGSAPLTRRDAERARYVSLKQAAALLNRDRNTVMKYLDQGMPAVEKADRDRGVSWVLDTAEIVRWLEERAAKNVSDRLNGSDGKISDEEAKRREGVARMTIKEAEAAESVKVVARISSILDLIRRDYTELRLQLMAVPDTIAGKVDSKVAEKVRKVAEEQIKNALAALCADEELKG
ncbi:terminase small subunit [Rhizobium leguminosarum]|nr:terminase small subunit [Rhizobium leguminosarum]